MEAAQIREGIVTDATLARLKALERPLPSIEGIEPTRLYSTNNEVDNLNNMRLSQVRPHEPDRPTKASQLTVIVMPLRRSRGPPPSWAAASPSSTPRTGPPTTTCG